MLIIFLTYTMKSTTYTQDTMLRPPLACRVRFSDTSEMVLVTKLSDTPSKHKIWYSQDELDDMKANMTEYIKLVRLHIARRQEPTASTILGMEKFLTRELTEEYKFRRTKLSREVAHEVLCHRLARSSCSSRNGCPDAKSRGEDEFVRRLARTASENSQWARERARAAALFLEQDQEAERKQELQQLQLIAQQQDQEAQRPQHQYHQSAVDQKTRPCKPRRRRVSLQEGKRPRFESPVFIDMEVDEVPDMRTVSPTRGFGF